MFLRVYTGVTTWWSDLKVRAEEEKGATAVEYALMVALIAVVIIAAVGYRGKEASNQFSTVGSAVDNAQVPTGPARRPLDPSGRGAGGIQGPAVCGTWRSIDPWVPDERQEKG